MQRLRNLIKKYPRKTILVSCILILFAIMLFAISLNNFNNNQIININPNASPISYSNNLPTSYLPTPEPEKFDNSTGNENLYVSAPVTNAVCNANENTFTNEYYSFCYPKTYTIDPGEQGKLAGNTYLTLTNNSDSNFIPFLLERVDGDLALTKHDFVNGFTKQTSNMGIDYTGNAMRELDKVDATEISFPNIPNFKGNLVAFWYKLKSSVTNTFFSTFQNSYPEIERTTFIFVNGNTYYIMIYSESDINTRIIDSLVFNK